MGEFQRLRKKVIGEYRETIERIYFAINGENVSEETKSIHKALDMKSLRDRMDRDVVYVLKTTRDMKGKLEIIDKDNMANRKVIGCEEGNPIVPTRTSVTNGLRKKLKDLMGNFKA